MEGGQSYSISDCSINILWTLFSTDIKLDTYYPPPPPSYTHIKLTNLVGYNVTGSKVKVLLDIHKTSQDHEDKMRKLLSILRIWEGQGNPDMNKW